MRDKAPPIFDKILLGRGGQVIQEAFDDSVLCPPNRRRNLLLFRARRDQKELSAIDGDARRREKISSFDETHTYLAEWGRDLACSTWQDSTRRALTLQSVTSVTN